MSVITARDVEGATGVLAVGVKDVITPLAADRAKELGVRIERAASAAEPPSAPKAFGPPPPSPMTAPAAAPQSQPP